MSEEQDLYDKWAERVSKAEKNYQSYQELIKEIRQYYKNEKKSNKSNLFWSSIETLKPFLYFKAPKIYVDRKSKANNPVESAAAHILEKGLEWDLEQFDFDSVIKYARNDFLLSGCGILYEKYKPKFANIDGADVISGETVETVYIDPVDFIADSEKVGIWENCTWVARAIDMTKREVIDQFGKKFENLVDEGKDKEDKNTKVYEIWDKTSRSVIYFCKDFHELLKQVKLPKLSGILPMPKPIFCTLTNDSLIPVPDYTQIKMMLDELDGINQRMRLTIQALKVSGCYDNSFPELANILDKEVTLISVSDFDKLKECGGISGIIDFVPIQQYIETLATLAQQRADIVGQIYEITGVSDIMRGNSDPNETATAVTKKTNFGTLRNQDRQNDMQRFITDLLKIKAEMICELFQNETLLKFAGDIAPETAMQAIALLRENKTRDFVVGIETDTTFTQDQTQEQTLEAVKIVNDMINIALPAVSAQPLLLPVYKQLMQSVVVTLPNTRQFEPVIDEVFAKIEKDLQNKDEGGANDELKLKAQAEMAKNQIQAQKNQNDFIIKQEQNAIKREELAQKAQVDNRKLDLTQEEMALQDKLKTAELAVKGNTNENITTGLVRGF